MASANKPMVIKPNTHSCSTHTQLGRYYYPNQSHLMPTTYIHA